MSGRCAHIFAIKESHLQAPEPANAKYDEDVDEAELPFRRVLVRLTGLLANHLLAVFIVLLVRILIDDDGVSLAKDWHKGPRKGLVVVEKVGEEPNATEAQDPHQDEKHEANNAEHAKRGQEGDGTPPDANLHPQRPNLDHAHAKRGEQHRPGEHVELRLGALVYPRVHPVVLEGS
eukprot:scaffold13561_cov129-Isochrysis_galbana.AAC.3